VVAVTTGALGSDIEGRAFVIHAFDGSRIACALIAAVPPSPPSVADGFVPYFSYIGALAVAGSVGPIVTEGVTQTFSYSLTDVDPLCSGGPGDAANSCGVHIHAGKTCTDNALGHYFTGTVTADPWTTIAYTTEWGSMASGIVEVTTGALGSDLEGRAVIIHGFDGGRIACALLGEAAPFVDASDDIIDQLEAFGEARGADSLDYLVTYFRVAGTGVPGVATFLLVAIGTVLLVPWVLMCVCFGWIWTYSYGGLTGIPSATLAVSLGVALGSSIAYGLGTLISHLDGNERVQAVKRCFTPPSGSFVCRAHAEMAETPRQLLLLLRIFPLTPINLLHYYTGASALFTYADHLLTLPVTALLTFMWVGVGGATVKVRQHDQGLAPDTHLAYAWSGIAVTAALCLFLLAVVVYLLCRAAKRSDAGAGSATVSHKDVEAGGGVAGPEMSITHEASAPAQPTGSGLVPPPQRMTFSAPQGQLDTTLALPPPQNQASIIADDVLPYPWREMHEDGEIYYYNDETGESRWELPTAEAEQERSLPISAKISDNL